ncbi:MAG: phosphoglucomutase [Sphaerochaetaceae bacterium]|jgi:phosphomannomutase|nr:phosphoglucomutase [Sphaerochaetaceae bacterium]HHU88734.1 phosphoglucomutase [Spirochaetales bacterium]
MFYIERSTQLAVANLGISPLPSPPPSIEAIIEASNTMLKGASGWRKVFALGGDEESFSSEIRGADAYLVALATEAFYWAQRPHRVVLGIDTRPTGPIIGDIVARRLLSLGVEVKHLFIVAAPEIMAYASDNHFIYISASHNPIGHNGFKFGYNGGVLSGGESDKILTHFNHLLKRPKSVEKLKEEIDRLDLELYRSTLERIGEEKKRAQETYTALAFKTLANGSEIEEVLRGIREGLKENPLGLVGELNGSARTLSIDRQFFENLGLKCHFINDRPREIVHQIVPEGVALDLCKDALTVQHSTDNSFTLGYVPDNDGDRGNIVYSDEKSGQTHTLSAQKLFALVALIELTLSQRGDKKEAIVVNGPTSLIIDKIASRLGVAVFRSEVGEANVVALAQQKRNEGWHVRLLGEGSNGGSITYPSRVRDPLNTLVALIKLLSSKANFSLITGLDCPPSIARALETLPKRTTTESFSPKGVMYVDTASIGELKGHYEELFLEQFEEKKGELLERFKIFSFRVEQTEGTHLRVGLGAQFRTPPYLGGLKIVFIDEQGEDSDFIWMRPSGTETLFRVLADAKGDSPERHDYLLEWQRELVEKSALKCQR